MIILRSIFFFLPLKVAFNLAAIAVIGVVITVYIVCDLLSVRSGGMKMDFGRSYASRIGLDGSLPGSSDQIGETGGAEPSSDKEETIGGHDTADAGD